MKGDEANPYLLRADIYDKRGETDKAIADLTRAAEVDPTSISPYINRANLYEKMGRLDRAIADYDKLISLKPGDEYYVERKAALSEKMAARTDRAAPAAPAASPIVEPPPAPAAKAPEPEAQKPAEPEKKVEQAPPGKHECRRYDAIANMTISVPCRIEQLRWARPRAGFQPAPPALTKSICCRRAQGRPRTKIP